MIFYDKHVWFPMPDGSYLVLPEFVFFAFGAIVAIVLIGIISQCTQTDSNNNDVIYSYDLPSEIQPTETAAYYDEEAERYRAKARMLEAQAEHDHRILQAALAADALSDIDQAVDHERSKRELRSLRQ